MTTARWYPTVVTMGDGDVFITSGSLKNLDFDHLENTNNPTYEFYPSRYGPNIFSSLLNWAYPHNLYPVCFQLPGGKIFQMVSNRTVLIDPRVDPQGVLEANTVEIASLPAIDHAPWIYPHTPTAFLLPLKESSNYTATVMICGGTKNSSRFASADCYSIQPDIQGAKWVAMPNMPHARLMPDSAVLPDGTIMLTNGDGWGQAGSNGGESNFGAAPVLATDIYDPVTNSWSTVGTSTVPRMYHSGVVLLEDATVITTGSEMANYLDFWGTPSAVGPVDAMASVTGAGAKPECYPSGKQVCTLPYEMRIERFTPPYLSNNLPRPILSPLEKGTKFVYGSTVGVQINPTGAPVSRITFVRYTTTTHSTNTDQRMIEPNLLFLNSTYAVFKIPPTGNIAPPGNYHMFALTKDGTPSVGQTVLLGSGVATVVTIPAGSAPTKSGSVSTISTGLRDSTLALVLLAFL
ncbi:hypothetical protein BDR26DRAFT_856168 [Obelidium mucronatum]|nr:hypothetical protein BDR26DRAFT_856168 [Obelidium mucronatum]